MSSVVGMQQWTFMSEVTSSSPWVLHLFYQAIMVGRKLNAGSRSLSPSWLHCSESHGHPCRDFMSSCILKGNLSPQIPGDLMTILKCINGCATARYTSTGIKFGRQCYCNNVTFPPGQSEVMEECCHVWVTLQHEHLDEFTALNKLMGTSFICRYCGKAQSDPHLHWAFRIAELDHVPIIYTLPFLPNFHEFSCGLNFEVPKCLEKYWDSQMSESMVIGSWNMFVRITKQYDVKNE